MWKFIQQIPQRLTRITSGGKIIREIDGLRFMAIMPVLVQHVTERFDRNTPIPFAALPEKDVTSFLAYRGTIGVYIFFVISGFILALPFAAYRFAGGRQVSIGQYFWRRVTRLEPTYMLWITIFFVVFVVHGHQSFAEYLPHYLANITYTHALFFNGSSPINPPTWTLEIEIQFYILAPLLAWLFFIINNKVKRRLVNIAAIVIMMLVQQYAGFTKTQYFNILAHLHYFLVGFMLADVYLNDWKNIIKTHFYDAVAIVAAAALLYSWSWNFELSNRLIFTTSLFVFFYAVFHSVWVNRWVTNRWVTAIGGMCYTIYLIHLPLAEFLIRITKNIHITNYFTVNLLVQLLIAIPIILTLSGIFFLLFEKPFMDKYWPQKLAAYFKKPVPKTSL